MAETSTAPVQAPILTPMQHITDIDGVGNHEKKHTPWVKLEKTPEGRVRVHYAVGEYYPHPNVPDHFIQSVHIYVGDANVAQFDYAPVVAWPRGCVEVDAADGTTVTVIEHCNLHGRWKAEAVVG